MIARRSLQIVALVLCVLAGTILGAAGVALGTAAGRSLLVRFAVGTVNQAIDGRLTVGLVSGSLLRGLQAHDVVLVGSDSVPFARVPLLSVRYRARDLLSGRIVIGEVALDRPTVEVIQQPSGRFNYQKIFRLGGPPSGNSKPLVAFGNVTLDGATLVVRTRAGKGDTTRFEFKPEVDSVHRIRRFENLSARLSYLRLSSPFPGEDAIVAEIDDLRTRISDPAMVIRNAKGRVEQAGDSVRFDLSPLMVGTSKTRLRGSVSWPSDTLLFDLVAETRDATMNDLRPLVPRIPKGLEGTGTFTVRSLAGDILAINGRQLNIVARHNGGGMKGTAGLTLGPRNGWSVRAATLTLENLDLEYVRPFLDTLPLAGRLTGTVEVDGPRDHLTMAADVVFRDSLVPGWPVSTVVGSGVVAVGTEVGVVFQGFDVRQANLDLATVRRLLPAVALRGQLKAEGALSGPWLEAEFDGTLRHADPPFPETVVRGPIQFDARGDTLGVWANLAFDSLRLAGFWTSYPEFRLLGDFAGTVRLEGYLNALRLSVDLAGPPGRVKGDGTLVFLGPLFAARDLDFHFEALDVRRMLIQPIPTALNGSLRGRVQLDSLRAPVAEIEVRLDTSSVGGSRLDSAYALLGAADSLVLVDTATVWAADTRVNARGGLGLNLSHTDSLRFSAVVDSVRALEPLLSGWLELPEDTARRPLGGTVTVTGVLRGALDAFEVTAQGSAPRVRWGSFSLASASVRGSWSTSEKGRAELLARADSLRYGGLGFVSLVAEAAGRTDSIAWKVRGQNGPDAGVLLAGDLMFDSAATRIPLDSARLTLPTGTWFLEKPTTVVVRDSFIDVGTVALRDANDSSRIELVGTIPGDGHGRLSVSLEALSLKDFFALLQRESREVDGTLDGTIDIAGSARAPQMTSSLTMVGVAFGDVQVPRVEGLVDYAAHRLQGVFTLRSGTTVLMGIEADLPIDLSLRGVRGRRQLPGELSIRAIADSVDLALLEAVSPSIRDASGRLDGDFGIIGTWERPQLNGELTVRSGALTYPGIGARHDSIDGRLAMHGDTLQVERLSLRSGGGTLNVTGHIRLERLTEPILQLHFAARDFFAVQIRNFVTATATGEFDLRGPMIGATFAGAGTVPSGTLYFTDLVSKRIVNLEDTLFRTVVDTTLVRRQGLGRNFQNRFIDSLVVDSLSLAMGSEVWLRSTESNIQLSGSMIFNKLADEYRVEGVLNTPRGKYQLPLAVEFATRDFTVTRGSIRFLGTPDLNALLDIDAQHVLRRRVGKDVNISVHLGGTLYAPEVRLSSDIQPPLPEAEIIAYLLYGGPIGRNTMTADAARALTQGALSALAGQFENLLLANLGSRYTPDYFQITPGEAFIGTQVEFGWQMMVMGLPMFLAPTWRFGCQRAFTVREDVGVTLEFRLTQDFRLAGTFEPVRGCNTNAATPAAVGRQAGVDVLWDKNY